MKKILIALFFSGVGYTASAADLVAVITDESAGASNGEIDLSVSGGVTPYAISWTGPAGFTSTSEDITGLAAGNYTVEVTDAYCGIASYTFTVSVANTASISEVEPFALSIFPNPTSDLVQIQTAEQVDIEIFSLDGKLIQSKMNATSIDLSNQPNGTYIVKFISVSGIIERKIVKE